MQHFLLFKDTYLGEETQQKPYTDHWSAINWSVGLPKLTTSENQNKTKSGRTDTDDLGIATLHKFAFLLFLYHAVIFFCL